MPDKRSHRGKHPEDDKLFADAWVPVLREAVEDLSHLLSREYNAKSALKLVGDRHQLDVRQRRAVLGAACSDESLRRREDRLAPPEELTGRPLAVDGYNLLITTESALSDAVLLRGRDGCIRDLASLHGSYRKVEETLPAISLIGRRLEELRVGPVTWYFDAPVSNSGRLKGLVCEQAEEQGWDWQVELSKGTDHALVASGDVVATSDSWILDRVAAWANVAASVIARMDPSTRVIDMGRQAGLPSSL